MYQTLSSSYDKGGHSMKNTIALLLCFALCGASSMTAAFAEAPQSPSQSVPDFYQWLDRYQNPAVHRQTHQPIQQPTAVSIASDRETIQPTSTLAENLSFPFDSPALVDTSYDVVDPGEGLGCFYHRSYYSHLPFFKGSAYNLAGSLAVAEPAQVPPSLPVVLPVNAGR
jgi:hypothetical protein